MHDDVQRTTQRAHLHAAVLLTDRQSGGRPSRAAFFASMDEMKTKPVTVRDRNGQAEPADLIVCPDCEGARFCIYLIEGKHQHLQCLACETTFCDGTCTRAAKLPNS
jgi:hypothetical protein